jgi:nucleotide-binding universal stress UspA family protein
MKILRRSPAMGFEAGPAHAAAKAQAAAQGTTGLPPRQDTGPIVVAVDGHPHGWDALEWAAAEAAARQCALRIVHAVSRPLAADAFTWPLTVDAFGDAGAQEAAEHIVSEAARRARIVAPALHITTHLQAGTTAAAVLQEGGQDALIVLGRGRKAGRFSSITRSVSWQVARHASCPVAMVELFDEASRGPSAGRVVVGVDGTGGTQSRPRFRLSRRPAPWRRYHGATRLAA